MRGDSSDIWRSVFWLALGALIEFSSLLMVIWSCLEFNFTFINENPFFTGFTIAATGFILSLSCILVSMSKPKYIQKKVRKRVDPKTLRQDTCTQVNSDTEASPKN